jgi:ATP-binding cassette subfamily B (MDR/TAP) protein 1
MQCGKSTTIGLVERFYDPLTGSVTLDGVPLSALNVASFRSQMSLVSQEPTLYRGSVRFNVLLGANKPAAEVTEEELIQACKDANIVSCCPCQLLHFFFLNWCLGISTISFPACQTASRL